MSIANLPFPRYVGPKHRKVYELREPLILTYGPNGFAVPRGTKVLLVTSHNFGMVVLPEGKEAPNGQRIFTY